MGKLHNILAKKIPDWRYNYKKLLDQKGNIVIGDVTIEKALSGCLLYTSPSPRD